MDRAQHSRYLGYLNRYEYFGRGKARLSSEDYFALEAAAKALDPADPESAKKRRDILAMLLRDN